MVKSVHGYIHCMPYGYVLSLPTPRPPDPVRSLPSSPLIVPFVWRLSPRQPGYVMTVCEEAIPSRREMHVVTVSSDGGKQNMVRAVVE